MEDKDEEFLNKAMELLGIMLEEGLMEESFICFNCGGDAKIKRIVESNRENIYASCKCGMYFRGRR
ncbi:hypothetical protein [Clostridium sp.]|jgi:hypothetical protein|uniref:hypothetical protein n=1 Tax=Clostridium sp. TaxID=1506 RepID=UPI00290297B9|nr:hypothetical protein [Clostridium sp.]MDU2157467.1 hypothetical protein [Clostridium sp.]